MDFIIDMQRAQGDPANTCDVGTISFIDTDINEVLSTIAIPDSAFVSIKYIMHACSKLKECMECIGPCCV